MAANKVVLGLQWGDEGKGKVIDLLSGAFDLVVRCQGGANAGHTVVVKGRKTVLHLLPSGALHPQARCVIGNGVVVDPGALVQELAEVAAAGEDLTTRLFISDRAHLVLPCHKLLDQAAERRKGEKKVGTTLRGIGPCYQDKAARIGLRCAELRDAARFPRRLEDFLSQADAQLRAWGEAGFDVKAMAAQVLPAAQAIAPRVTDTVALLHQAVADRKRLMFEGAQGLMLDIDFGTYPYVTSSNTGVGGVITGSGLSHKDLGDVIGIVKAYTTRVGEGPFPSEATSADATALREVGHEYGATTGRPRRCGWLDLVQLGYACRANGVDRVALTKLDVLTGRSELTVCTGYELDGRPIASVPALVEDFARVKPVCVRLPGWSQDIRACHRFGDLPATARSYVDFVEQHLGVPIDTIGTGPDREETIQRSR